MCYPASCDYECPSDWDDCDGDDLTCECNGVCRGGVRHEDEDTGLPGASEEILCSNPGGTSANGNPCLFVPFPPIFQNMYVVFQSALVLRVVRAVYVKTQYPIVNSVSMFAEWRVSA